MIGRYLLLIAAVCSMLAARIALAASPSVELFSPEGPAKQVRQVVVRFDVPMVALGDPRLSDPMVVGCPASGKGRWADTRNWVYDFDTDLPAGLRCSFTLLDGLKALDGTAITGRRAFEFSTGGPAILASYPREGATGVDEEQVFLLKLDAPADRESIESQAYCAIEGVGEKIPVEVLTGEARAAVLRNRKALGYQYFQLLWKNGAVTDVRVQDDSLEQAERNIALLRCQRHLPPAARVLIQWGRGIKTESGIATTADQQLHFRVRAAFMAQVECTRVNARAGCLPMLPISVRFSAPVPRSLALGIRIKLPGGKLLSPVASPQPTDSTMEQVQFPGPFPELKPVTVVLPANLSDDAGRILENAARFPLEMRIDALPPLAKFSGTFGILEAREGGVLPVTLRNLEPKLAVQQSAIPAKLLRVDDPASIASWMRRVEEAAEPKVEAVEISKTEQPDPAVAKPKMGTEEEDGGEDEGGSSGDQGRRFRDMTGTKSVFDGSEITRSFQLAKPKGPKAFEVVGIPLKQPGFYVVELQSRILGQALLGRDQLRYVATAALVTNLAVHLKLGREASAVWVTRLNDGAPVAGAEIAITNYCDGTVLWRGRTDKDGIASAAAALGLPRYGGACNRFAAGPLMVSAKTDTDFSFALSSWDRGIDPYQFNLPLGNEYSTRVYHAVLDRPLYRAGEVVSMKHFLRHHVMAGIEIPEAAAGTRTVVITHPESGHEFTTRVTFDKNGIAESQWKIPAEAALGRYIVSVLDGRQRQEGAQFRVEQFRLPSMHASVTGSATALVRPKATDLDLHVAYMSGGGAPGLPVTVRTIVEPRPTAFPGYGDYEFGGKPVSEGLETDVNGRSEEDSDEEEAKPAATQVIPLTLDSAGSARVTIPNLPALDGPAQLTAELEYADANGEVLTSSAHVQLVPSALAVGIRREGWAASTEQIRFRVLLLDLNGKAQIHHPVQASLYQVNTFSYRKRLIGGFYAYESTRETRKIPAQCQGDTDEHGVLSCELAPGVAGEVLVRAEARDEAGNLSGATVSIWVADKDSWWFGGTSGDRMDVLPEKNTYEAGETARFQVRMPFREASALVTVEREGVMASFVTHLDAKNPMVEVPIANEYAPNVFVSVLAVRGRVPHADHRPVAFKGEEISALVDLNKPAFRLGIAAIKVGWKPHRLDVDVTPERSTYKVREQASVRIHVTRADGGALPAGTEVAIAAVDGALLELAPNHSWDLLASMMGERGLEVSTATAQMQVVGKRHYGRKAVPSGGGGGRDRTRELFDTLLYWKARVPLDERGDAVVSVPLNDSLSEFQIVAIASGGAGYFGTGSAALTTTQDLILLSGLPPLVREGDRYTGVFTVRNAASRDMSVEFAGSIGAAAVQPLSAQRLEVAAGHSVDVAWSVTAPIGQPAARWDVSAHEVGGNAADHLRVTETVIPAYPVRTYQATISQLQAPIDLSVQQPAGAIAGRGGLDVTLRAHLGDSLDGVREFVSLYPYNCIEQLLSRAVALGDRSEWDRLMQRLPAYLDADGLVRYFPTNALRGDDALTAYILAIGAEAGWGVAAPSQERMIDALRRFIAGRLVRDSALPTADLTIRKLAAIEALSRYGKAEPGMLASLSIEPNLWPTSAVLDWLGILQRVPGVAGAEDSRSAALQILRSRLHFQGTEMVLSTERTDALWWLMISADSNANRLLLAVLDRPEWRQDIPRLVRGMLARQRRGHWNTTVANAWGVLALQKYSAAFESVAVTGTSSVSYGADTHAVAWDPSRGSSELSLPWQQGPGKLELTHSGNGAPWVLVRATAALPLDQPLSSGFRITRTVTPIEQQQPGHWTRGDVLRVQLQLEAQSDMTWVVVDDPIPAGASILGSGLAGQSQLLQRDERQQGFAWPAFEERRFDAFRAYYRFVPKGAWTVEYTVRLNNPGTFLLPSTRVEAMYAPEMLGESPNGAITVAQRP